MKRDISKTQKARLIIITLTSICNYNFRSFRRFLIYAFHFSGCLDLRKEKNIEEIPNERLILILEYFFEYKVTKQEFYYITGCSKNTFNKKLKNYFVQNQLEGRRKFTLLETYGILNEWQGKGNWGSMEAIKKEKLADIFASGDYKKIANEFELKIGHRFYKNNDRFTPKEVKVFLEHIDMLESEQAKEVLGQDKSREWSLWMFTLFILFQLWESR